MFFALASAISGIFIIYKFIFSNEGGGIIIYYTTVVIFAIFAIQVMDGITDYPYLIAKMTEAKTLQVRINDIRESNYEYTGKGALISGNIENWKQSTNLSNYIAQVAEVEAAYNSYLAKCKVYKETFILRFLGNGWIISDKIYDLKPIKLEYK